MLYSRSIISTTRHHKGVPMCFYCKKTWTTFFLALLTTVFFTACSGEDGKDGVSGKDGSDGKDAEEVNVDSLAKAIKKDLTKSLWDSMYAEDYVDTVYELVFDNTLGSKWMDSVREALLDSLTGADYDSLYQKLFDSVYADIYSQNIIKGLRAHIYFTMNPINGAFANLYPVIYGGNFEHDGFPIYSPISLQIKNTCFKQSNITCRWNKVMVKSWIEGFTDTASVTDLVNPDTSIYIGPSLTFDESALAKITEPTPVQIEVRVYALENDKEILFYSSSEPVTLNPMQINGGEFSELGEARHLLQAVWVTPAMDSIEHILDEVAKELPNGTLKVYQKYSEDDEMAQSSMRVASAIFDVLKKRGIKYIENDGAGVEGQKINYPIEVLRSKQAVCNEFSFLFASILEAAGFDVFLVKIPNHMFVGWRTDKESNTLDFIETTMLNDKNATAADAINSGRETFTEESEAGRFEDGSSVLIDIGTARKVGVVPNVVP